MYRTFIAAALPVVLITGCSKADPQPEPAEGAKPITVVTPSEEAPTAVHTPTSTLPAPETPTMKAPDSMPRETDYNNNDVQFVAESAVRSERILKAAELYLADPGISAKGKDVASRAKSQHSVSLMAQKEMLAAWGVGNPETIFPAHPVGIPTEADIDQLGALHGKELDTRFLEILRANMDGSAESARHILGNGFNPEVKSNAELIVSELEKEKASITEAMN